MGKWCLQGSSFICNRIFVKLADNQDRHKISDRFQFRPGWISHFGVTRLWGWGERGGSVVECRTPEREVGGSRPTAAVLCPWARHFTPRKYWLITQEALAPSRHDWKIVDWDVKLHHKQNKTWGWIKFMETQDNLANLYQIFCRFCHLSSS